MFFKKIIDILKKKNNILIIILIFHLNSYLKKGCFKA